MAFDEGWHFGIIRFYSHHLSPIVTSQPSGTYKFGALIQNNSFLYHYLLSFPERLILLFHGSLETQAIILRLLNVVLAATSLLLMRKLLKQLKLSPALTNVLVLLYAFTPLTTVLSAQINYDNLLIPLTVLSFYEAVVFCQKLNQKIFDTKSLLVLTCACLLASVVKYAFLPIAFALAVLILWRIYSFARLPRVNLWKDLVSGFVAINRYLAWSLTGLMLIGMFLFVRIYAVNVVKYHTPIPECNQVLNVADCKQYYSWAIDYNTQINNKLHPSKHKVSIIRYSSYWLTVNSEGIFGEVMPLLGPEYVSPLFYMVVVIVSSWGLIGVLLNLKDVVKKHQGLLALFIVSLVYTFSVWSRNYHDYTNLGSPVSIDGRYMMPVLLIVYAFFALGIKYMLEYSRRSATFKATAATIVLFVFLVLGGFTQYVTQITPKYGTLKSYDHFIIESY